MLCPCLSKGGRFVLKATCTRNPEHNAELHQICLLIDQITEKRRESAYSALKELPTFIIDLILEFEKESREENARSEMRCEIKNF